MEDLFYKIFLSIAVVLGILNFINRYWDRKGFVSIHPSYLFGNFTNFLKKRGSLNYKIAELYWESLFAPYYGIYLLFRPAILFRDPKIITRMLFKDFDHIRQRRFLFDQVTDEYALKISQNEELDESYYSEGQLFSRENLNKIVKSCEIECDRLKIYLQVIANNESIFDVNDVVQKFSINVFASIFFGLDVNTWENSNHTLSCLMKTVNKESFFGNLKQLFIYSHPKLLQAFKSQKSSSHLEQQFNELIINSLQQKKRTDLMELFYKIIESSSREKETIKSDGNKSMEKISIEEVTIQIFILYIIGVTTTSTTVAFCLYELSKNDKILKRVCQEINKVLNDGKNAVTYDAVQEMSYLDLCVKETLRLYPSQSVLNFECKKDYTIEETKQTILKGTPIVIPVFSLHRDFRYFKDPNSFRPERFQEENTEYFNEDAFIPFKGPKLASPATEISLIATKIALVSLLSHYKFCDVNQTMVFDQHSNFFASKHSINLRVFNRIINNNQNGDLD